MRRFLCSSLPRWTVTLGGLALATIAVAAYPLGLDINPAMGPRRIVLLAVGLGAVLLGQASAIRNWLGLGSTSGRTPVFTGPDDGAESSAAPPRREGPALWLLLSLLSLAIVGFYVWLVTAAEPGKPPNVTFYYDMLAEAFASGQTHLKAVPDPRLADLNDPYDPAEHRHIPRCHEGRTSDCLLLDATYYNGKYYLYWGPAPAALLAPLKLAGVGTVADSVLALVGAILLFAFTAAFLVLAWRRYFRLLPIWLLVPPFVLAGLAYPLPWVLDGPRIYEAAILLGAAFMMAGLVVAFPVLSGGEPSSARLVLVGVLWGLSFATRSVLLLPIVGFSAALAWMVWRRPASNRRSAAWVAARLVIPMVVTAMLIGLYNFARFSNPLEFGWRYTIGAPAGQAEGILASFRPANIPVNFYNYALAPASLIGEAPFLRPVLASRSIGTITIPHPAFFYGELVTGLLFSTPFLLFAIFALWWLPCDSIDGSGDGTTKRRPWSGQGSCPRLVMAIVLVGCFAASIPLLSLYAVTARYLLDVSPLLILVAGVGAWIAYGGAATRASKALIGLAIVASALASAVISILLTLNNWQI